MDMSTPMDKGPRMKLVMVGNGMAGVRTLEELLKLAPDLYDITVFGAEPHPNYNRILLSPVLAGEQTVDDIVLNQLDWYSENHITLHVGKKVVKIDRKNRAVEADDGTRAEYDRLLLATGSNPFILPVPGANLPGVISFRDIADVDAMIQAASQYRHAVVIGGGLLGLEAANGLMKRGMDVTVVHLGPWLMERQLDEPAARLLQKSLEEKGMKFLLQKQTDELVQGGCSDSSPSGEGGRVAAIKFKDGDSAPADLVVMAVGIRPNTELAESAGLHCNRGIVVNDTMQTFDPRIYSIGECAAHRGIAYGLVAPLFEQARVCANHLAHYGIGRYEGSITSTKLKVTGIDLFSAGDFVGGEGTESILYSDPIGGVYKKLVIKDNKLVGGVMVGDTVDGSWYFSLLRDGKNVSELRDHLMFGQDHCGNLGHGGVNKAATMTDEMEVCGCNGVCKGDIVKAIREKGLFTLEDVRRHTKASSSCGSCTGLVEQILAVTAGGDYSATPKTKSVCGCTDHTHEEARAAIRQNKLLSIPQVMAFMEWRTPNGCASCRPALNYYLISTWPGEAEDDPQSRFINERAHANIQKDGTYSVIPRMWGGNTTPSELRRIATVAEKYNIPTVHVTGGQRIDLLGVKKEDLPMVWADLDMPSGHAYGKALRTVKTCVGSEWCRFGTQNSTQMGIDLEKAFFKMWAPHKVKLAVSGCPRNCAEATCKDVGIICVDSGYQVGVAGAAGMDLKETERLCDVPTEAEAIAVTVAFIQLYRETAKYLDRPYKWVAKVGLDWVKGRVVDNLDERARLIAAFELSQSIYRKDPWADHAKRAEAYQPLADLTLEAAE